MKPKPKPAPKPRAGRPPSLPADAKPRTIRMTDAEREKVIELLRALRAGSGRNV